MRTDTERSSKINLIWWNDSLRYDYNASSYHISINVGTIMLYAVLPIPLYNIVASIKNRKASAFSSKSVGRRFKKEEADFTKNNVIYNLCDFFYYSRICYICTIRLAHTLLFDSQSSSLMHLFLAIRNLPATPHKRPHRIFPK